MNDSINDDQDSAEKAEASARLAALTNRLAEANSPYLLQHKHNPVHWQLWNEQTLALARSTDRPILLSIGYSACHWCHVMARESFEDDATAAAMNRCFINIKVDREERPDLDKIYQLAHQLLNRSAGGWPLTVFLDPQSLSPFFSGTYFPPQPCHGMPSFMQLMQQIAQVFEQRRNDISKQQQAISQALLSLQTSQPQAGMQQDAVSRGVRALLQQRDQRFGGFGNAPKFPQAPRLELLLYAAHSELEEREPCLEQFHQTLDHMAAGGLYDHLAGGFFRYCVDEHWTIPHFEKMLYDNGQLLSLYAQSAAAFSNGHHAQVTRETAHFLLEQLQSPEGGFYSALDADSLTQEQLAAGDQHGHEGEYYVWTREQVEQALTPDAASLVGQFYGLTQPPNFEGRYHLRQYPSLNEAASRAGVHQRQAPILLQTARQQLKAVRAQRPLPHLDDKLLTSWNAMTLKGLAQAARTLNDEGLKSQAQRLADFLRTELWRGAELFACYKNGRHYQPAFLDDYALTIDALTALMHLETRAEDLLWAVALADRMLELFYDEAQGGFYFAQPDQPDLLLRPKQWTDEAVPSGAGVALQVLQKLGILLGETRYLEVVETSLKAVQAELEQYPGGHASVLTAQLWWQQDFQVAVVTGKAPQAHQWLQAAHAGFHPNRWIIALDHTAFARLSGDPTKLDELLPDTDESVTQKLAHFCRIFPPQQGVSAKVCQRERCFEQITELPQWMNWLEQQ